MSINLHIYPSSFRYESRILREINAISESQLFNQILVIATWEANLKEVEILTNNQTVRRIKTFIPSTNKLFKLIKYLEWQIRVFYFTLDQPITCVSIHSLSSLSLAIPFKIFRGSKLVYATHELETETIGLRGLFKIGAKTVEKLIIKSHLIDCITTVNQSIATWYIEEYGLNENQVISVRNIPDLEVNSSKLSSVQKDVKAQLKLPNDAILFIYQGCISEGRGIEIILKSFQRLADSNKLDKHVLFIGYGELVELVQQASKESPTIHYYDAVSPDKLAYFTKSADIGISLIENACLSYYYSLPNKVFEYLVNQLPIIVSDFPEMRNIISCSDSGWVVDVNEDSLLHLLQSINKTNILQKKSSAINSNKLYNWSDEKMKLIAAYKSIIN